MNTLEMFILWGSGVVFGVVLGYGFRLFQEFLDILEKDSGEK